MKHSKTITLAAFALAAIAAHAQNYQQGIRVVIDGNTLQFDNQQPVESGGRILVPLRGIFEKLGATVEWDRATQTIRAQKNHTRVKLEIGQLDATVNQEGVHMDVAATLYGGTTMVPLRFVSEALGAYVNWNADNHEVDITSSTEYNLPIRHGDNSQPPPQIRPLRPVHQTDSIIPDDTIIPLTLKTRMSSYDAHVGDAFVATLNTGTERHYLNLPAGTEASGTVSFVRKQSDREPGVIELSFDHLTLPDGRNVPVEGRVVGLDAQSVIRRKNGVIVPRNAQRTGRVVFAGYGPGSGLIVGIHRSDPLEDSLIGSLLSSSVAEKIREKQVRDVELRPGTDLGLRLYKALDVPRDK